MITPSTVANPFALITNPEVVLKAIEQSARLEALNRRVYRPLDRPLIPKKGATDVADFDNDIDAADDPVAAGANDPA